MRIRITRYVTGMVRGITLPRERNAEINVPDALGAKLCADGIAVPVQDLPNVERAIPPPDPAVETRQDQDENDAAFPTADAGEPEAAAVRSWAVDQGFDVPARGRLPQALYQAYSAAHSQV